MLRNGCKFFNVFSKVSFDLKSQIFVYPFQKSNYGKIVSVCDEDVFGNLSPKQLQAPSISYEREEREEMDETIKERISENLVMKLMLKSVAILDYDGAMKHFKDFVAHSQPNPYMYRLLFSCGAKLGKAQETFSLYQDLRKRGIRTTPAMYTSLLYACTNCGESELALRIAKTIGKYITQGNENPNEKHINALLMVFARHGDMKSAFNFVDYLDQRKIQITTVIYNSLIENCCSNKEYGLRLAVLLYHRMVFMKQLPNIYTFFILAKCIKNCNFGDSRCTQDFLKSIFEGCHSKTTHTRVTGKTSHSSKLGVSDFPLVSSNINEDLQTGNNIPAEGVGEESDFIVGNEKKLEFRGSTVTGTLVKGEETSTLTESDGKDNRCEIAWDSINVLKPRPHNVVHINCDNLSNSENRLMMFGGIKGFLEVMSDFGIKPNIRLLSLLLQCLPQTNEAEEELLQVLRRFYIKQDVYFFNILLNRMVARNKFQKLEEYFDFTRERMNRIDWYTIGILARVCDTKEKAMKCIEFARSYKIRINFNILEILLKHEICDPDFVLYLKEVADEEQIELNDKIKYLMRRIEANSSSDKSGRRNTLKRV